jgi:hypothetical protein
MLAKRRSGLLRFVLGHVEKIAGMPLVLDRVQHWPPSSVARGWSDCREKHQYGDRRLSLSRQSHSSDPLSGTAFVFREDRRPEVLIAKNTDGGTVAHTKETGPVVSSPSPRSGDKPFHPRVTDVGASAGITLPSPGPFFRSPFRRCNRADSESMRPRMVFRSLLAGSLRSLS